MTMDNRLSPQLSDRLDTKGKVSRYLTDQDGWSQVPLLVSGNYSSPRFSLDPKGLKSQAKQAITNELGRQLNKLFKKQSSDAEEKTPQSGEDPLSEEDQARKLLQDSLQKLFGN
jgi:AsmA protein